MAKRIITLILLSVTLFGATAAHATVTCYRVGNYTYCNDYSTGQRETCYQVGNYTYCN